MNTGTKVAAAVASGYLLGRSKKMRLAIVVGGLLAGKKIPMNTRALVAQGSQLVENNPELAKLAEQVRGELFGAARTAAVSAASRQMNGLSDRIKDRTTMLLAAPAGSVGSVLDRGKGRKGRRDDDDLHDEQMPGDDELDQFEELDALDEGAGSEKPDENHDENQDEDESGGGPDRTDGRRSRGRSSRGEQPAKRRPSRSGRASSAEEDSDVDGAPARGRRRPVSRATGGTTAAARRTAAGASSATSGAARKAGTTARKTGTTKAAAKKTAAAGSSARKTATKRAGSTATASAAKKTTDSAAKKTAPPAKKTAAKKTAAKKTAAKKATGQRSSTSSRS